MGQPPIVRERRIITRDGEIMVTGKHLFRGTLQEVVEWAHMENYCLDEQNEEPVDWRQDNPFGEINTFPVIYAHQRQEGGRLIIIAKNPRGSLYEAREYRAIE